MSPPIEEGIPKLDRHREPLGIRPLLKAHGSLVGGLGHQQLGGLVRRVKDDDIKGNERLGHGLEVMHGL